MPDGNARRRGEEELPPDPWAGLAASPPPTTPPPPPTAPQVGPTDGHVPPPRRTVWHHPAVWVAVLLLAGVLLLGALLERPAPAPREPSPDAVTALADDRHEG